MSATQTVTTKSITKARPAVGRTASSPSTGIKDVEAHPQLARIAASSRTPFEKRVWSALCQVPAGQVTTYAALAAHLGSSPRAVGNALRRNPFAPEVPCHRVIATGGTLGGFKGKWPRRAGEGITIGEKRMLLKREGVKMDAAGKVLGSPFTAFTLPEPLGRGPIH